MKRVLFLIVLTLALSAQVFADYSERLSWNEANVDALHGAAHAAVARFVNDTRPLISTEILPISVGEFGWVKVGGGESDFVVLLDFSERRFFNTLWIYSRDSAGSVKIQELNGWEMGKLGEMVRDFGRRR